jgi:hypothetical protein
MRVLRELGDIVVVVGGADGKHALRAGDHARLHPLEPRAKCPPAKQRVRRPLLEKRRLPVRVEVERDVVVQERQPVFGALDIDRCAHPHKLRLLPLERVQELEVQRDFRATLLLVVHKQQGQERARGVFQAHGRPLAQGQVGVGRDADAVEFDGRVAGEVLRILQYAAHRILGKVPCVCQNQLSHRRCLFTYRFAALVGLHHQVIIELDQFLATVFPAEAL